MYQIDNPSAATVRPGITPAGPVGYFTDGNAQLAQQPTILPAEWLNGLQDELLNILKAAGIAPDKTKFNQLVQALGIINAAQPAGSRNQLINGDFNFWQRGTSFGNLSSFTADRWQTIATSVTGAFSTQSIFALGDPMARGATYAMGIGITGNTDAVNHNLIFVQRIEGVARLAGTTVTVSGSIFNANATPRPIALEFNQNFGTGGSASVGVVGIGSQQILLQPGWNDIKATVAIPSISGKVLGTTLNDNLTLLLWLSAGTSWNARTANLGAQTGSLTFAHLQVEPGSVATTFEKRPLATELALCQRYFEKTTDVTTVAADGLAGAMTYVAAAFSVGDMRAVIPFKVNKRAVPVATFYASNNVATPTAARWQSFIGGGWSNAPQTTLAINATWAVTIDIGYGSGLTVGTAYLISGHATFDAEI